MLVDRLGLSTKEVEKWNNFLIFVVITDQCTKNTKTMSLCGGGSGALFRAVGGGCRLHALSSTSVAVDHCASGALLLQQRRQIQRDATSNSVRESFSEDNSSSNRRQGNGTKRWLNYSSSTSPNHASTRERNITVASFYNQNVIDKAAVKVRYS